MPHVPENLRYTREHEYVKESGEPGVVAVGITDYAQGELGDIVWVNLPKVGRRFAAHDVFGTIEAVKAVSDLFCPLAGEVVAVNPALEKDAAAINRSPYDEGWMIRLKIADPAELDPLLTASDYRSHTGT